VAKFIVLCTFDRAGVSELVDAEAKVADQAGDLMKEVGGKVDHIWLTTGAFDMVVVVDAPSVGRALSFLAAFAGFGGVSTQTLAAEEGVGKVFSDAKSAKTNVGKTNVGSGGNG
jgi:uncharacterized protein with GYD domain